MTHLKLMLVTAAMIAATTSFASADGKLWTVTGDHAACTDFSDFLDVGSGREVITSTESCIRLREGTLVYLDTAKDAPVNLKYSCLRPFHGGHCGRRKGRMGSAPTSEACPQWRTVRAAFPHNPPWVSTATICCRMRATSVTRLCSAESGRVRCWSTFSLVSPFRSTDSAAVPRFAPQRIAPLCSPASQLLWQSPTSYRGKLIIVAAGPSSSGLLRADPQRRFGNRTPMPVRHELFFAQCCEGILAVRNG